MANLNEIEKALKSNSNKRPENTDNRSNRKERIPISEARTKLNVTGKEPGFHYAWINDYNVDRALDGGYEYVEHAVSVGGRHVNRTTNTGNTSHVSTPVGAGVTAFLMRLPSELYIEDRSIEHNKVDQTEATMKRDGLNKGLQGTIEITSKRE